MTVAATSAWNPTVADIMKAALLKVGAIDETETPNADMYADAINVLNGITKEWEASGIHVWTEEEAILFLQKGQYRYLLGGATTDHCVPAFGYTLASLAVAGAASAGTITLVSAAGLGSGDSIGVALDSGVTFWTTINGAPAGAVVTLTTPIPTAASVGNLVFDYPHATEITRPLKVPNVRAYRYAGPSETPMRVISRQEYMDLPNKTNQGTPTQAFYAPRLLSGELYVWNMPSDATWGLRFTWYRSLADFLVPNNTADFPQEWISALTWALARELMVSYEVPPPRAAAIDKGAMEKLALVQGFDRESEPINFGLDVWPR